MQLRYTQMLAGLRQALSLVDQYVTRFPALTMGRGFLATVIEGLAALAVVQSSHRLGRVGERTNERRLARALRRYHIRPVIRMARMKVPEVARLDAARIPRTGSNYTALATAAYALTDAVTPFATELHLVGLPIDFIPRMRSAADALIASVGQKGTHKRTQIGATRGIVRRVEEARRVINGLDSLVRASLPEGDPIEAEWDSVVRDIRGNIKQAIEEAQAEAGAPAAPALPIAA